MEAGCEGDAGDDVELAEEEGFRDAVGNVVGDRVGEEEGGLGDAGDFGAEMDWGDIQCERPPKLSAGRRVC